MDDIKEVGTTPEIQQVEIVETPQPTLRETISAEVDKVEAEQKAETKDDRPRGPDGKFLPKEAAPEKPEAPKVERPKPPSTWKKDYHSHWETIDPKLAEYILQRESEYAKGVSTYKQEYDRAKPFQEAMAPFMPLLEQNKINPSQWITNLGNAHKALALGNPEDKLSMFLKLAQDYQVPIQSLFMQGQDGKVYFNPQIRPYQPPAPQADINKLVESKFAEISSQNEIQRFTSEKDAAGNPAHPHYETVRETMAQLLEAGLADDLKGAYDAALRHPRHSDIFESMQKESAEREAAEKARKLKEEAESARRKAVSPKGSTPLGKTPSGKKGLRDQLSDNYDQFIDGGRV